MGLGCKNFGKLESIFRKQQNRLDKEKAKVTKDNKNKVSSAKEEEVT